MAQRTDQKWAQSKARSPSMLDLPIGELPDARPVGRPVPQRMVIRPVGRSVLGARDCTTGRTVGSQTLNHTTTRPVGHSAPRSPTNRSLGHETRPASLIVQGKLIRLYK